MQAKPPTAAQQMLLQYLSTGLALPAASAAGMLRITAGHQSRVYKTPDQQCSGVFYACRKINSLALSLAQRFIERYSGCSIVGALGCRV